MIQSGRRYVSIYNGNLFGQFKQQVSTQPCALATIPGRTQLRESQPELEEMLQGVGQEELRALERRKVGRRKQTSKAFYLLLTLENNYFDSIKLKTSHSFCFCIVPS